jgi:hypothetical protein
MAHSFLIYQRPVDAELQAELNHHTQSARADAIKHELYQPTMFMIGMGDQTRDTMGHIFDEGNGYGNGDLSVEHIRKHSSMSVGDLVVNLLDNSVQVCMPMGWYELFDTSLNITPA